MVIGARANTKKAGGLGSTGGLFLDLSLPVSRSEGSASRPLEVKLAMALLCRIVILSGHSDRLSIPPCFASVSMASSLIPVFSPGSDRLPSLFGQGVGVP